MTLRLLDLTRLMSRLGQGQPTGIDRVEAAYLAHLLALPAPCFGLVRSTLGYLLLNRDGMARFQDLLATQALPPADWLSRLVQRNPTRARAETALRQLAIARVPRLRLRSLLRAHLRQPFSYLNTGHANLTAASLRGIKRVGGTVVVLIHDTIPLDHPEFTRAPIIPVFNTKIAATAAHADLVIHTAQVTRAQTETHFARYGRVPPGIVAPLGITPRASVPPARRAPPYFVTLGTIEPRKNHGFLLDLWAELHRRLPAADIPHLLILGCRGWADPALFARLDSLTPHGQTVFEYADLPDDQVTALMAGSCGLLFPSHVEGYGLPPLEAASLGIAVIVPPLPIYRETLGNYPVYASLTDRCSWLETIIRLKAGAKQHEQADLGQGGAVRHAVKIPHWQDHFKLLLSIA
jgi:glycosyltransferase involved in cell wall biosynthesis